MSSVTKYHKAYRKKIDLETKQINVRVPNDVKEDLDNILKLKGITIKEFIINCIKTEKGKFNVWQKSTTTQASTRLVSTAVSSYQYLMTSSVTGNVWKSSTGKIWKKVSGSGKRNEHVDWMGESISILYAY